MGNFRYEDHLQRHQHLLREAHHERLVNLATPKRRWLPSAGLRHMVAWLRITIRLRSVPPPAVKPVALTD